MTKIPHNHWPVEKRQKLENRRQEMKHPFATTVVCKSCVL